MKGLNYPMPVVQAKQVTDNGDDFDDGVTTGLGAATAITDLAEADVQLLV